MLRTCFAFTASLLLLTGCAPQADPEVADSPEEEAVPVLYSSLETIDIETGEREVVLMLPAHFEAPNWSPDGTYFLFNSGGRIFRLLVEGGEPGRVDAGFAVRSNNDHGVSPDGETLSIIGSAEEGVSIVYTLPIEGGLIRVS